MFCFQCEQTAGCKACAGNVGVCGKKANTETFGHPEPTQVSLTLEKGPFIVITCTI